MCKYNILSKAFEVPETQDCDKHNYVQLDDPLVARFIKITGHAEAGEDISYRCAVLVQDDELGVTRDHKNRLMQQILSRATLLQQKAANVRRLS